MMENFIVVELTLEENGGIILYIAMGIFVIVVKLGVLRPTSVDHL